MFRFILKIIISWPLFLLVFLKIYSKNRKKKKGKIVDEEKLYRWVKRYSSYLFWIFKKRQTILNNGELWDEKSNFIVLGKINYLLLLFLLKSNNFEKNAPISLLLTKTKTKEWPKFLVLFFNLVNNFYFSEKEDQQQLKKIESAIKNIQIPRTVVCGIELHRQSNWKFLLDIAYGGYSKILLIKIKEEEKQTVLTIVKKIEPKDVITVKKDRILEIIKKKI